MIEMYAVFKRANLSEILDDFDLKESCLSEILTPHVVVCWNFVGSKILETLLYKNSDLDFQQAFRENSQFSFSNSHSEKIFCWFLHLGIVHHLQRGWYRREVGWVKEIY